ncbi:MAG: BlaI/MecI/CopY family transcriptional regulator [Acidobacteriota bacterium]
MSVEDGTVGKNSDPRLQLTEQELEIMKVIWQAPDAVTVRDVYEVLLERRKVAYTTVMTMMGILEKKGHLTREKAGRAYCYRPVRSRKTSQAGLLRDFVERVFDGSARPLLLALAEEEQISEDDLDAIRRKIEEVKE